MASGKPMAVFFGGFNLVGSRAGLKRYYKLISALDFWSRNGSAVKAAIVGSAAIMKYGLFSFSLFLQQRKKKELYCHYSFLYIFFEKKNALYNPFANTNNCTVGNLYKAYFMAGLTFISSKSPIWPYLGLLPCFHGNYNFLAALM